MVMKKLLLILSLALTVAACEKDDKKNSYACNCDSVTGLIDYPLGNIRISNIPLDNNRTLEIFPKLKLDEKEDTAGLVQFMDVNQIEDVYYNSDEYSTSGRYFLSVKDTGTNCSIKIRLKGQLSFSATNSVRVTIRVHDIGVGIYDFNLSDAYYDAGSINHSFDIDKNITISQDNLKLTIFVLPKKESSSSDLSNVKLTLEQPTEYKKIEVEYNGGRASYVVSCNE